jgi:hypothetical protein
MYRLLSSKFIIVLAGSAALSLLSAATPAIGVAMSQGSIVIDSALSAGNSTIFDGNTLQTDHTISQIRFNDGGRLRLDNESRAKLFRDHLELQLGSAQISGYNANANGLSVRPEGSASTARVALHGKTVEIAALAGNVAIFNANGINVANLAPGKALSLLPQDAGASAPSSLTGCAVRNNGNLLLTDETTSVVVQLRGGKVQPRKRIQVMGSVAAGVAAQKPGTEVLDVTSVKEIGGQCNAAAMAAATGAGVAGGVAGAGAGAAAGAGGAAAGAAAGVGGVAGATTAVVAGVVAAAAGVGAAVAVGTLTGSGSPPTP